MKLIVSAVSYSLVLYSCFLCLIKVADYFVILEDGDIHDECGFHREKLLALQKYHLGKAQTELSLMKGCHEKEFQAFLNFKSALGKGAVICNLLLCCNDLSLVDVAVPPGNDSDIFYTHHYGAVKVTIRYDEDRVRKHPNAPSRLIYYRIWKNGNEVSFYIYSVDLCYLDSQCLFRFM